VDAGKTDCVRQSDKTLLLADSSYDAATVNRVIYRNIVNPDGSISDPVSLQSDVFVQFYLESAVGCYYNDDPEKCQILANLCVLQLYDLTTNACKLV
jgi:hypothetical protein